MFPNTLSVQGKENIRLGLLTFGFRLSNYGTISLSDRVILFGTNFYTDMSPAVVVYKNDIWTQIGTQSSPRSSYGVIHNGEVAMIVGGYMTQYESHVI